MLEAEEIMAYTVIGLEKENHLSDMIYNSGTKEFAIYSFWYDCIWIIKAHVDS